MNKINKSTHHNVDGGFMKRKVKFLIPVVAGLILVGCKQNVSSSSSSSSKPLTSEETTQKMLIALNEFGVMP